MKKFFVFISYNSKDVEWAKWLEHELEFYHLPSNLDPNEKTHHKEKIRDNLRDVFWDSRLAAGGLNDGIKSKLSCSTNLIVICSPNSANVKGHPWVNEEIKYFIELGRLDHIYPFIVDGKEPKEFFPPSLLNLPEDKERVGGNVNKDGKDLAFIKIVAGMLDVDVDVLWQHYEKEKAEQERKEREQKEKLQTVFGRYLGEKAVELVDSGDSYLAATLIMDMYNSGMGIITPEAEKALRKVVLNNKGIIIDESIKKQGNVVLFNTDGKIIIVANEIKTMWDSNTGAVVERIKCSKRPRRVLYMDNGRILVGIYYRGFELIDPKGSSKLWGIKDTEINGKPIRHFFKDVDFSSDGRFAIAATQYASASYHKPIIHLISLNKKDVTQKELVGEIIIDEDNIPSFNRNDLDSLSLASDNDKLAIALRRGEIYIWSIHRKKCIYSIQYPGIRFVRFSHNGKSLLAVTKSGNVEIRNTEDFNVIKRFYCNTDVVFSVYFSQDDKQVFLCSTYKEGSFYFPTVYVCNIEDGNVEKKLSAINKEKITFVNYNEKTNMIVSASEDGLIQIWNEEDRIPIKKISFPQEITHSEYNNEGRFIVVVIRDASNIYIIDANTLEKRDIVHLYGHSYINSLVFSPCGRRIYISDNQYQTYVIQEKNNKWLCEYRNSDMNRFLHYIDTISMQDKDGRNIICQLYYFEEWKESDMNRSILIISELGPKQIGTIPNVLCPYNPCRKEWAVDKKGKYLVIRTLEGFITVFSLEAMSNGICKEVVKLDSSDECNGRFTPNGRYYISVVNRKTINIWDTEKWKKVHSNLLISSDDCTQIDCSPDSKYLIAGYTSGKICIWDIKSGIIVEDFQVKACVTCVRFNPDINEDSFIVTTSNGNLLLYQFKPLAEIIKENQIRFSSRKLSDAEKKKFYLE